MSTASLAVSIAALVLAVLIFLMVAVTLQCLIDHARDELARAAEQRMALAELAATADRLVRLVESMRPFRSSRCLHTLPGLLDSRESRCELPAGHLGAHQENGTVWQYRTEP